MERLDCHVKQYAWGKRGRASEVAKLYEAGHSARFLLEEDAPYSELWMGTHPDGAATLHATTVPLSRHIAATTTTTQTKRQHVHLPFIMKVMSIEKTLSLQVHPNKQQAAELHERDPVNYPDRNHKPELAYALTRFELLCGFRPADELVANMRAFAELRDMMGEERCAQLVKLLDGGYRPHSDIVRAALKACFQHMLYKARDYPSQVCHALDALKQNLLSGVRGSLSDEAAKVVLKMMVDFPGDVGCFAPLYLNHMILAPGECCYYAAEELHAYLSGECVECVGCSNNTIRAAMTPKFIDRESLLTVLNYRMTDPQEYMVRPRRLANHPAVVEYAPDCDDFQLHRVQVAEKTTAEYLPALDCASIMVIVEGEATLEELASDDDNAKSAVRVKRGDIFYIAAGAHIRVSDCTSAIDAYRTFSYEIGPDHESRIVVAVERDVVTGVHACNQPGVKTTARRTASNPLSRRLFKPAPKTKQPVFDVEAEMDGFV